jgi:hypothetical protein
MSSAWFAKFFEGDDGLPSMPRLIVFASWFPATGVLWYLHNENALSIYLMTFVVQYVAGKGIDAYKSTCNHTQDAP